MRKRPANDDARATMKDELQARVAAIDAEIDGLKPYLLSGEPPTWAIARYRELARLIPRGAPDVVGHGGRGRGDDALGSLFAPTRSRLVGLSVKIENAKHHRP
jgi:hypothetical protein